MMNNKFEGTCSRCRRLVAPGAGELTKTTGGWKVTHISCPPFSDMPTYDFDFAENEYPEMSQADWRDALNPDEGDKG